MNLFNSKLTTHFEAIPSFIMQARRMSQIIWLSVAGISIRLLCFAFIGVQWNLVVSSLVATLLIFLACLWLMRKKQEILAATLYIATLTVLSCALIFQAQGLHDEAVVIFPCLLLFSALFSTRKNFITLSSFLIGFLGFIAIANDEGWHRIPDVSNPNNFSSFISLAVILGCNAFFAYVLSQDLRKALADLNDSKNELLEVNNQLEERIIHRTEQIDSANKALQKTITQLEQAMNELANAEKLASLGAMVAGISHELNTPIGNALLASSSLDQLFQSIAAQIKDGNIRRSTFDAFIKDGHDISSLVTTSIQRAGDLIVSFKQVAVDQTSEQRRTFDLQVVIDDNLKSMMPTFNKKHIQLNNLAPSGIELNSFPGPLGQILTNIIQNAAFHAFDGADQGTLTISADDRADHVIMRIADNGVGMPHHITSHVFDPFFTTKLGKGGSGLGLSISHRIATSVLGGNLTVESSPGCGCTFVLTLPKNAPFPLV